MKLNDMYPSQYLKCEDLEGKDKTLTINTVEIVEMGQSRETKPVVHFYHSNKSLVLNKTNALIITKLYGDDSDGWQGKQITLYPEKVPFQGKLVDSIRIRDKVPAAKRPAAPAKAPGKQEWNPGEEAEGEI